MELIVKNGNSKLGAGIGKVALPAVQTCPGRGECEKVCYAAKLEMRFPNYEWSLQAHLQILENDPDLYAQTIIQNIKDGGYDVVRVHESGDFYSLPQIRAWHKIAKALPNVHFYAYTRSWSVPLLRVPIENLLKRLDNFTVRASIEPGEKVPQGWAWNTIVPKDTTERPDGGIICHEQTGKKESCKDCKVCWVSKAPVLFLQH